MQQTAEVLVEIDRESRLERRNRILGRLALSAETRLLNNDPLAHVFLRLDAPSFAEVEDQVRAEYRGDMSERSDITSGEAEAGKERPFQTTFDYILQGEELIYAETGKRLNELLGDGVMAAEADFEQDQQGYAYHLERAKVLANHGPAIAQWRKGDPEACAVIASLCPPESEISAEVAKKGSFKPGRAMASVWVLEPTQRGVQMSVFSLDQLTLKRLQSIYDQLEVGVEVEGSTLEELGQIRQLNTASGDSAVSEIIKLHDSNLDKESLNQKTHYQGIEVTGSGREEAYEMVRASADAERLYFNAVESVACSLREGKITPTLGRIISELRSAYKSSDQLPAGLRLGRSLTIEQSREFMDYLRCQVLSEHIFGDKTAHVEFQQQNYFRGDYGGIAAAGSYASAKGISRAGDCPTSTSIQGEQMSNANVKAALGVFGREEFESKWCPNCLKKPKSGKTVKAWRQGDRIGCGDCGQVQDVCTGRVVKKGRSSTERVEQKTGGFLETIFNAMLEPVSSTANSA
jgi:hypothetical protein